MGKGFVEMKVEGFDELRKAFKQFRMDFEKEFKKVLRREGRTVLNDAKTNFQKNYTMRTGKGLGSFSLTVKEKKGELYAVIKAGGGEAYYMPFLELGTSKLEAKPFMRPAIDDNRERIVEAVRKDLAEVIRRAGK